MLFNSYIFIFIFLPVALIGYHLTGKYGRHNIAISWIVGCSLFFYGWWNPAYLGLIVFSILMNYAFGLSLGKRPSKPVLITGITINLAFLAYYKYANFFIDNLNYVSGFEIELKTIILPLAISFFTFQQITYLIDAYRGETREYNFLHYCLFVTFFPQLIAGPIVHHKEMMPQFARSSAYNIKISNLTIGLVIFFLGLFKKVVIADNMALFATPAFDAAHEGIHLTIFEAWGGALAYTFQLYFDFSGYSDMAIGLARMFGIKLPLNFYSPYKANNIIDFWRRWHMTLSRFLRDYLYIPLGGSRKGKIRRYINLLITMLLGGLWHGAGWTFIVWGLMHGIYLVINHAWHAIKKQLFGDEHPASKSLFSQFLARTITFLAVVFSWVMFRAETTAGALKMYSAMLGFNGIALPYSIKDRFEKIIGNLHIPGINFDGMFNNSLFDDYGGLLLLLCALLLYIVWFMPNTIQIMNKYNPALGAKQFNDLKQTRLAWRPGLAHAGMLAFIAYMSISSLSNVSEFLYFQF